MKFIKCLREHHHDGRSTNEKEKCAKKKEEIENQKWLFVAKTKLLLRKRGSQNWKVQRYVWSQVACRSYFIKDINEKFM